MMMCLLPPLPPEILCCIGIQLRTTMRHISLLARKVHKKFLLHNSPLWKHMKEIIPALSLKLRLIYVEEEPGPRLVTLSIMIWITREDEDWLEEFNNERKILSPEKLETLLFKLEVFDHKARERSGVITPTSGAPIPVLLQLDAAAERERWQKPILHHLQVLVEGCELCLVWKL